MKLIEKLKDYSEKFIFPSIIHLVNLKNEESTPSPRPGDKLQIYKSRRPYRILPLIKSGLKVYRKKGFDIYFLDKFNSPKFFEEMNTIPAGFNIAYLKNKQIIKLVGAGAVGNWMSIPKSDKIFKTMYSKTGTKTMADYIKQWKEKNNYFYEKKEYPNKILQPKIKNDCQKKI